MVPSNLNWWRQPLYQHQASNNLSSSRTYTEPEVKTPLHSGHGTAALRVLHLHSGNLYGGVETLLKTLALQRHVCPDLEPHFALCYEGRLSRELNAAGVPVHLLGDVRISRPWTGWPARRRIRKLLRQERFDAVICHMPWPLAVFGGALQASRQRVIFWAHSAHYGRSWLERMARRTIPDLAIANSRFVAATLPNLFAGVPAPVMYYPVELPDRPEAAAWRQAIRRELAVDDGTTVIIQVSRYEAWKGHLLHLRALSQVKAANPWVCWMVGGPQNPEDERHFRAVQETANQLRLGDRVRFLGQRSDVPKLLAGADIFCQPNQGPEPFGIVFVEALWAGLPVVTTAMGGALEIIEESSGLLVKPEDPVKLAAALGSLIDSPERRAHLGRSGPARSRQLCDPASQIAAFRDLVRNIGVSTF